MAIVLSSLAPLIDWYPRRRATREEWKGTIPYRHHKSYLVDLQHAGLTNTRVRTRLIADVVTGQLDVRDVVLSVSDGAGELDSMRQGAEDKEGEFVVDEEGKVLSDKEAAA